MWNYFIVSIFASVGAWMPNYTFSRSCFAMFWRSYFALLFYSFQNIYINFSVGVELSRRRVFIVAFLNSLFLQSRFRCLSLSALLLLCECVPLLAIKLFFFFIIIIFLCLLCRLYSLFYASPLFALYAHHMFFKMVYIHNIFGFFFISVSSFDLNVLSYFFAIDQEPELMFGGIVLEKYSVFTRLRFPFFLTSSVCFTPFALQLYWKT